MFSYIVTKDGVIRGGWQTEWDSYSETEGCQTVRISDDEYDHMKGKMEDFTYDDKKKEIKDRGPAEKQRDKEGKEDWIKNNTLAGLREQIQEIKRELLKK